MRINAVLCAVLAVALSGVAWADASISGRLFNMLDGSPIMNAVIRVDGLENGVGTGPQGHFIYPNVPSGTQTLSVYYQGVWYEYIMAVDVGSQPITDLKLELPLHQPGQVREQVVVTAGRAPATVGNTPDAVTVFDRKALRHHIGKLVKQGRLERIGVGRHAVYSTLG